MTITTVRIIECTSPTELYRRYSGQSDAQDAYIELDLREGTLLADWNSEVGNAVPFTVAHGFERRYSIPILTGDAANRVMQQIAPLADRILADWEEVWDGNNMVARFGEDAQAADAEIVGLLGIDLSEYRADNQGFDASDLVAEWDVDGATNGGEGEEYGITGETTDERLDEIAREITSDMAACGDSAVAVVYGLDDYLRQLRTDLADTDA
jgi:hypothetical protein